MQMLKANSTQQIISQPSDAALHHDEREEELRVSLQLPLLSEEEYDKLQMRDSSADISFADYAQVTVKCMYFHFCTVCQYINLLRFWWQKFCEKIVISSKQLHRDDSISR